MNIIHDHKGNLLWDELAVIILAILLGIAAIYAVHTSNRNYTSLQSNNAQFLPREPGTSGDELQTQSSGGQSVNNNSSAQIQTGSSSVQQASPDTPQNAGASNPGDPYYCDPNREMACANPY